MFLGETEKKLVEYCVQGFDINQEEARLILGASLLAASTCQGSALVNGAGLTTSLFFFFLGGGIVLVLSSVGLGY